MRGASKEEKALSKKYRVFIVEDGMPWRNLVDLNSENQNSVGKSVINTYVSDLGFPRPRYFSIRNWLARGIHVKLYKNRAHTWRHLRAMSLMRKRGVFILWGTKAYRCLNAIEPNMGHLVILGGYPGISSKLNYFEKTKPFSTVADWLGITREIWRL